jgi:S-adenosylmethionine:tRNA ribosyltransferase-isomerase
MTQGDQPSDHQLSSYDYDLPPELIAQRPADRRDGSRMLLLDRGSGNCELRNFSDFADYLQPGDCLVLNDTRVIPARLYGSKAGTGGKVEALMVEEQSDGSWTAMLRPGRRLKPGTDVDVDGTDVSFTVDGRQDDLFVIRFADGTDVTAVLEAAGRMPLPPYIQRQTDTDDLGRYQTVYAQSAGAVAAPTAGLHFTDEILAAIADRGVDIVRVTLHVGLGTFKPVETEDITAHAMHDERFVLSADAAARINATKAAGGRVIAVGTTSVRVVESCADDDGTVAAASGRTELFMYPPMTPKVVNGLLTNFHLPKSTLLMLVSTFASREKVLAAYRQAAEARFRFFSYGDCMFIALMK